MNQGSQAPSGEGLIGVEEVTRAIRRYVEGSYSTSGQPAHWRIHDTERNNAIVEIFTDREDRDRKLAELNIRAAISAHLEALRAAGYMIVKPVSGVGTIAAVPVYDTKGETDGGQ